MPRLILNISKAYSNGFIAELEKSKFFQLHKLATSRTELYSFAISIAIMEGAKPSEPQSLDTFVRTAYLGEHESLLSSLYFDKKLKENTDMIDDLCNRDEVYSLAEQYANAGFEILKGWVENMDEETLFYKLLSYMNDKYDKIHDDVDSLMAL